LQISVVGDIVAPDEVAPPPRASLSLARAAVHPLLAVSQNHVPSRRRPESSVSGSAGPRHGRGERKEREREQFNDNKNFNVDSF
jgi:hypothetical protein